MNLEEYNRCLKEEVDLRAKLCTLKMKIEEYEKNLFNPENVVDKTYIFYSTDKTYLHYISHYDVDNDMFDITSYTVSEDLNRFVFSRYKASQDIVSENIKNKTWKEIDYQFFINKINEIKEMF